MKKRGFTVRVGPIGLSLAAAVVTAAAFAAISLADNGSGGDSKGGDGPQTFRAPAPPGGGAGVMMFRAPNLSAADRQKLEDFQGCMEDNGAPAPPDPEEFDPSNPPKPPSAADREKLQKAFEACKDKLPADMQKAGPPQLHIAGCAPPGAAGTEERGKKQN